MPKKAAAMPVAEDIAQLSFEQALSALEGVVQSLEQGDIPLEKSIALAAHGQILVDHCNAQLGAAELRVKQLKADEA